MARPDRNRHAMAKRMPGKNPVSPLETAATRSRIPARPAGQAVSRPFIIPLFIPHSGCPHQCAFCNQHVITGTRPRLPTVETLRRRIIDFLAFRRSHRSDAQIAFFGGNFLGMTRDRVRAMLDVAESFVQAGQVDGIRFSTRPDTITTNRLAWLAGYSVQTIELGVQSMDNRVLERVKRGHRAVDTQMAVGRLRKGRFSIGLQLMLGLPGENRCSSLLTARAAIDLKPDFVRLYPTLVLKNSPLEDWYRRGTYRPLTLQQAVNRTKRVYLLCEKHNLPVIRMGLQASAELHSDQDLVAGPHHPAFGHLVHSAVFLDRLIDALAARPYNLARVTISVHPAGMSRLRGHKNRNLAALKDRFDLQSLHIRADSGLNPDEFRIEDGA